MELNANFDENVIVTPEENDWIASPMAGVDRMMLDRIGDEVARATTIVRYAPNSKFSAHTHDGGEEFIVLEGVFEDEHGAFPAGSYIRNPPTSSHTPGSAKGCVIFVKLWQFAPTDRTQVRISTDKLEAAPDPNRKGVTVSYVFDDDREEVRIENWVGNVTQNITAEGGAEILVLNGELQLDGRTLPTWSWIRRAAGQEISLKAGEIGARLWIKKGHLKNITVPQHKN